MENKYQITLNKYLEYIKNNKYNVYFIVALAILISLIIAMIAITVNTTKKGTSSVTNPTPQAIVSPIPSLVIITTPDPTQTAEIENQTNPQITPNVAASYTVSTITKYGNNWAYMIITNPDVGNGAVIVKKVNGRWKVVLGPGSYFTPDQLNSIGAPQQLIDSLNVSPQPSLSPSQSSNSSNIQ